MLLTMKEERKICSAPLKARHFFVVFSLDFSIV